MSEIKFVDRRTLVQVNATILAGTLIFMTLDQSQGIGMYFFAIGFYSIIVSIGFCFFSHKIDSNIQYTEQQAQRRLEYAEYACFVGILLIFSAILYTITIKHQ